MRGYKKAASNPAQLQYFISKHSNFTHKSTSKKSTSKTKKPQPFSPQIFQPPLLNPPRIPTMPILTISPEALDRILIIKHFGGFDAVETARDIQHHYPHLELIQPVDIDAIFTHQQRLRSLAWTHCTEEMTAQSPTVLRVLMNNQCVPRHGKPAQPTPKPRRVDPDFGKYTREEPEPTARFRPEKKEGKAVVGRDWKKSARPEREVKMTPLKMNR